jgi:biopolymer transport protein ExbD
MSFGSLEGGDDNAPMADINMVPLIDVMLVLLVIFLITAPMLTHAVKVELPRAASTPLVSQADNVQLSIDANSRVYWNGKLVDGSALQTQLEQAAKLQPPPALHIRAERTTPYEKVAQVMSAASIAGLSRIGFVTDPSKP